MPGTFATTVEIGIVQEMKALRWVLPVVVLALSAFSKAAGASQSEIPIHILTGMHELCYERCYHAPQGLPVPTVAPWLSWAMADPSVTDSARRAGIHTYAYIDPSIQYDPKRDYSPLYSDDETTFLHGCDGGRAKVRRGDLDGFLMDQGASSYRGRVRAYVDRNVRGHYDALFVDDIFAAHHTYATVVTGPCNRTFERERDATFELWSILNLPVIFNGLGDAPDDGRTDGDTQSALDAHEAIGGMYEFCLSTPDNAMDHTLAHLRVDGAWLSAENSHLETVARGKHFLCYAGSETAGDTVAGRAERAYVYASFLLVYEPTRSILEMAAATARTRVSVFPESTLVAKGPLLPAPQRVDALRTPSGAYVRKYARCYMRSVSVGPCAAVVNPSASHSVAIVERGYEHALTLRGGALLEGGRASVDGPAPRELPPASGTVLFR